MNHLKYPLLLLILTGALACTQIETDIPLELRDNEQVVEYLTTLNESVTKFNKYTIDLAKITEGKDIHTGDSLSKMQVFKLAKTGGQFMLVSKRIEELIENKPLIEESLSSEQLIVFKNKCREFENKMGNIDLSELNFSEEQIAELKQKFEENKTYNQQKRAYYDSISVLNPDTLTLSENHTFEEKVAHHPSKKKKILFFVAFGLVLLVFIAGVIFGMVAIIKKIKNIL